MENQFTDPTSNPDNKPKKWKPILYAALLIVIGAGVIFGIVNFKKTPKNENGIVDSKVLDLPADGRQALEAQLADLNAQANSLTADAKPEDRYRVYSRLAEIKYRLGLYAEALESLSKVSKENQDNPTMHAIYTEIYRDMGDLVKARESAKKTVELDGKNPQAWLAHIDLQKDSGNEAVSALYLEALDKTSSNIGIITSYAQFLEKIGDKAGAIAQWQKAGQVFPQGKASYDSEISRLQI